MKKQKFHYGDLVHIAKNLGKSMSHFTADVDAIVTGSYNDKYGGGDTKSYTVFIKDQGETSWYYENQLTLIKHNQENLLKKWKQKKKKDLEQKSNLDWIFSHGKEVVKHGYTASAQALADCGNFGDLWGRHGEGIDLYYNTLTILRRARPFLLSGDKEGWRKYAKKHSISLQSSNFYN